MSDQPKALQHIAYTPEQAAAVTGRNRSRIFKAIKNKELTARKDGKATLIEDAELRRWVSDMPIIGRHSDDTSEYVPVHNKSMQAIWPRDHLD